MSRLGGPNEALLVDLITQERFPRLPGPPGYQRHAGQGAPDRLEEPYAPPPRRSRHVHKSTRHGTVFVGEGQPCWYCAAELEERA